MGPNVTRRGSFMITKFLQLVALVLVLLGREVFAGETTLGHSCDLTILGATDKQAFLRFDKELHTAMSRQDVAAVALLVKFPLPINYPDGSTVLIGNVKALQTRFAEVFPLTVRSAVLNQKTHEIFCKDKGLMYGRGELWVRVVDTHANERYRIFAINLPPVSGNRAPYKRTALQFVCDAEAYRVVVDTERSGGLRYRAWNQPRELTNKPDIEIITGTGSLEGSGVCTHAIWTFKKGTSQFTVSELGCTDGSEPAGTSGELVVSIDGDVQQRSWCK